MQLIAIADTHGYHRALNLPPGDVLIHAGDITASGRREEVVDFLDWFSGLPYAHKIFIGGNHDFFLDNQARELLEMLPPDVVYLRDEGYQIGSIKLWGSPVTPDLPGWAFGKQRQEMEVHWRKLPRRVDVLITHTPPLGILDKSSGRLSLGCEALLQRVQRLRPKYHLFGHIHASYGTVTQGRTTFVNASVMNTRRGPVNAPMVFEL